MTQFELWIDQLRQQGLNPKNRGGYWLAQCPAHNDEEPSLSINEGREGRVLVNCHAGCTFEMIRDALNVQNTSQRRVTAPPRASKPKPPPTPQPLPSGPHVTVYPYVDASGEAVLTAVRRQPPGRKKQMSQWTPAGDGLWVPTGLGGSRKLPLYRLLPILNAPADATVTIVEGEKCVHACLDRWPEWVGCTWAGGTEAWKGTDWTPLAGRTVTLVADGDRLKTRGKYEGKSPGHECMKDIAAFLTDLGCTVWIVLPPQDDTDIADWLAEDPSGRKAGDLVRQHRQRWHPGIDADGDNADEAVIAAAEAVVADAATEPLRTNQHYRLLGLHGDLVAVRIAAGRLLYRSRESLTAPATLIALAPQKWWSRVTDGQPLSAGTARAIGDSLVRAADRLGPVDLTHVTGRGAVRTPEGEIVYHLGDRLWLDGEERDLEEGGLIYLSEPRLELAKPATDEQMAAIGRAVMGYRWASPMDGRRLMGWVTAALIGGALEWRPHVLMNAPAGSGKSWLMREVVHKLMGPMLQRIADATPAALARLTANASLPVAWDEFEPADPGVDDLLKMLRISSGAEGMRVRADNTSGGVLVQEPRFCALLSGTSAPLLSRANASRLALVRLGGEVEDWPAVRVAIQRAMHVAERARARIVMEAPELVAATDKLAGELQDDGLDSRESLASAAISVGWQAWGVDNAIVFAGTNFEERSDAGDCILDILAVRTRVEGGRERSVLGLLRAGDEPVELMIADLFGVKRGEDDSLLIAPKHRGLAQSLNRTSWAGVDLSKLLRQLPGATLTDNARRFGAIRCRAIRVSAAALHILGVSVERADGQQEIDF